MSDSIEIKLMNSKCNLFLRCDTREEVDKAKKTLRYLTKMGWIEFPEVKKDALVEKGEQKWNP